MTWLKIIAVLLMLSPAGVSAQQADSLAIQKRRIIGLIPVRKNTVINGLAIGLIPATRKKAKRLHINGLTLSASPIDPFAAVYALSSAVYSFSNDTSINSRSRPLNTKGLYPAIDTSAYQININGLMIGSFNVSRKFNGLNVCIVMNSAGTMNGLAITGMFNLNHSFNGIQVAGLLNKTTVGRGLQVGLFNSCKTGKLLQLGLINKIGKRVLPFINAKF